LALVVERPALYVTELFEDAVARHHLVAQRAFRTARTVIGLELGIGALHHFERRVEVEVVDQVRREVVGGPKRGVQVRGRR
jgi:hypothetical protein